MKFEPNSKLLEIIRCPISKSTLTRVAPDEIQVLNEQIELGKILNRLGQVETDRLEDGFFNSDRSLVWPVRKGILVLVADQALCIETSFLRQEPS